MPNQSLLYTGRVLACSQLHHDDAHRARALRRPDLRHARTRRRFRAPETEPWLEKFYTINDELAGRGPPQAARLRARSPEFRLRRPPADLPAVRAIAALRPSRRRLPRTSTGTGRSSSSRNPPVCPIACCPGRRARQAVGPAPAIGVGPPMSERIMAGGHNRVRPFNTADTYPEQRLDNDLCQAVVAGDTIYLRGQVAQDLDTRENVAIGDPAGQAAKVMDNIELLLARVRLRARARHELPRLPDRHPPSRGGLRRARRAPARRLSGLHRPRRHGARAARVARRGDGRGGEARGLIRP